MSPEWLTAIGTLGTFIVIAASAVAALMQLRHMRAGNQIVALNEVRELPQRLTDPEIRRSLADRTFPAEYQRLRTLANFFEHLGTLVKKHIIDADIAADLWGGVILVNWYALAPIIANRRLAMDQPAVWENFEYLAVLCQKFKERHPKGTFPRGIERMPAPEIWPEVSGKDAR